MKLKDLIKCMSVTARIWIFDTELKTQIVYKGDAKYTPDEYLDRRIRLIDSEVAHINILL